MNQELSSEDILVDDEDHEHDSAARDNLRVSVAFEVSSTHPPLRHILLDIGRPSRLADPGAGSPECRCQAGRDHRSQSAGLHVGARERLIFPGRGACRRSVRHCSSVRRHQRVECCEDSQELFVTDGLQIADEQQRRSGLLVS